MFERLITLIGENNFKKINEKKILLIGLGGVGSYALEALVRNGFYNITVVDYDKIDITNLNRQLITNQTNIGKSKVIEAIKHAKSINPELIIDGFDTLVTKDNIDTIISKNYDYIIDACDDIDIKFLLIKNKEKYHYKLISSMGTAKKLDPTKLTITTLDKTTYDPIAKILRTRVKHEKINKKIYVVSSNEEPADIKKLGTANLVPSVAGLLCVSFILNDIIK